MMVLKRRLFHPSSLVTMLLWMLIAVSSMPLEEPIEYVYAFVALLYLAYFGVSLSVFLSGSAKCEITRERITIAVGRRFLVRDMSLYGSVRHRHYKLLGLHLVVANRLSDGARTVLLSSLEYKGDFAKIAEYLSAAPAAAD